MIMRQISFHHEKDIVQELMEYLQGDGSQVFKNMLSEDELDVIEHTYFYHWGLHLRPEDFTGETAEEIEEKYLEAYTAWMDEIKYRKRKGRSYQYDAKQ